MTASFGEALQRLRGERGLTQQQLAEKMNVDRSTVTNWETGRRMPDAETVALLSKCLGVDVGELLRAAGEPDAPPKVILLDDEKIILAGGLPVLREALPGAEVAGFTVPADALAYARENPVALAFLDIEMGRVSGLDVCRELLSICPRANVIYLTAYREYSFDAWETGACGFLLKPLTAEKVRTGLSRLRYPFSTGGTSK
ncbi:MAG: helix-turn-helix domain-containing protein [Oscillospiraceae bacterium]|nr:helix-turn-helix domain-containing protein [Oscillospiraceae bacterium]